MALYPEPWPPSATILSMRTAGFVLVGGHSSRMGRDKALLPWRAKPLVEHIAKNVKDATGNVTLVGAPDRYQWLDLPRISDFYSNCGPLGGVEAALGSSRAAALNLIVACDLPDLAAISTTLLQNLLTEAERSGSLCVTVEDISGQVHPLCAVYRHDCLTIVRQCLREGGRRMTDVVRRLGAATWRLPNALTNVNTPEEWAAWQIR